MSQGVCASATENLIREAVAPGGCVSDSVHRETATELNHWSGCCTGMSAKTILGSIQVLKKPEPNSSQQFRFVKLMGNSSQTPGLILSAPLH